MTPRPRPGGPPRIHFAAPAASSRHPIPALGIGATLALAALLSLPGSARAQSSDAPRTRAERTGYTETSHYDDVVAFLDSLERRAAGRMARGTIGSTSEGRALPYVVASRPLVRTPAEARALRRPIVYVQGNIHAGEVEGKEALQALLRDLVLENRPNALDSIVLVAIPIYNADGNEKWGPQERQRGAQNGPETVGQRPNAQGFDLNRDYMKAEAPETRASLDAFAAWDPDVFVDLHTTNGSYHGYALTYAPSLHPAAYAAGMKAGPLTRDRLLPELRRRVRERRQFETFDYGNFVSNDSVHKGWFTYDHRPRFGTNYHGLRGRVTILSEAYSHDPFERRVKATYAFVDELLSLMGERSRDILATTRDPVAAMRALRTARTPIPMRAKLPETGPAGEVIYEELQRTGDTLRTEPGVPRGVRRTGNFRRMSVPIVDRFEGTDPQALPWGWVVAEGDTLALAWLRRQHVAMDVVSGATCTVSAQRFTASASSVSPRAFQGRREARVSGTWGDAAPVPLARGAFVVRSEQPLGLVAMLTLEPTSDDGLVGWNEGARVVESAGQATFAPLAPLRLADAPPAGCALRAAAAPAR